MGRFTAPICIALLLAGCTAGASRRQQHAADAIAGTQAMVVIADQDQRSTVAQGIVANIEGATGVRSADLPPASSDAGAIAADPTTYAEQSIAARDETLSKAGWWAMATTVAATLGAIALRATGAGGPVGALIAGMLESKAQKADRDFSAAMATGFSHVVTTIEALPNDGTIGDLKKRISKVVPPNVEAAIKTVLTRQGGDSNAG